MSEKETPKDVKAAELAAKGAKHLFDNKDAPPFSWKKFWKDFQEGLMHYVGALVFEKDKYNSWTISIGRVSWWLAFTPALYIFIAAFAATKDITDAAEMVSRDITPNHLTILLTLAGYNFGKKIAETVNNVWGKSEPKDGPG